MVFHKTSWGAFCQFWPFFFLGGPIVVDFKLTLAKEMLEFFDKIEAGELTLKLSTSVRSRTLSTACMSGTDFPLFLRQPPASLRRAPSWPTCFYKNKF